MKLTGRVGKTHSFVLKAEDLHLKTTETVAALARPAVEELGFTLYDVEFVKEYGNWVLTLYIDRPEGVSIDDCERVSRRVDPILDEADPIGQPYYLSVSSLGLDRPLKKDADFTRNLGKEIVVKLYAPQNGKKELVGELISFDGAAFTVRPAGQSDPVVVLKKDAALIKPNIVF